MKTKWLRLSILVIIALSLSVPCFALSSPFSDLDGSPAKDKIIKLQEEGYVAGYGNGIFGPDRLLTNTEGIQLVVSALKLNLDTIRFIKEPKATDYFSKANDKAWYASALIIASVRGLEFPSDTDPALAMTREEFTYYLVSSAERNANLPLIKIAPKDIKDSDKINILYSGVIQRALAYGVVTLDDNGDFRPKDAITRAEAAEQVYNMIEYLKAHPSPVE